LASAAPRSPYRHLELCGIALIVSQMLLQRPAQPSKHSRLAIFVAFHNFQFHNLAVLHKKM